MNFIKEYKYHALVLLIVISGIYFTSGPIPNTENSLARFPSGYKCPAEYPTKEEWVDSITGFLTDLEKMYPGITTDEAIFMRDAWFAENKCEVIELTEPIESPGNYN